jgi:uncharacterized phage-associated protein
MTVSSEIIADYFLSKVDPSSGDLIALPKLQKLVYYAQAWHLTLFDRPLFQEPIQAWRYGPVCPGLQKRFGRFTGQSIPIDKAVLSHINALAKKTRDFLDEVWDVYGKYTAPTLEKMIRRELPWTEARGSASNDTGNPIINPSTMKDYYGQRIKARRRIREDQ